MASTIDLHGWTAVPRAFDVLKAQTSPECSRPVNAPKIGLSDTALAQEVLAYAREQLPLPTLNHSLRVYCFARVIQQQHYPSWQVSQETLLLAALLHDIGTTPEHIQSTRLSFEFGGGYTALTLLKELGSDVSQAESVCETIIRHQDIGTSGKVTQLTALILFATVLDNAGLNAELVHRETIVAVTTKYPRHGWTGCFADVIRRECTLKPWANTTRIDGFVDMVEGNEVMREFD